MHHLGPSTDRPIPAPMTVAHSERSHELVAAPPSADLSVRVEPASDVPPDDARPTKPPRAEGDEKLSLQSPPTKPRPTAVSKPVITVLEEGLTKGLYTPMRNGLRDVTAPYRVVSRQDRQR